MMISVSNLDILKAFSASFDLVNRALVGHHDQVSYIAFQIGRHMGLSESEQLTIAMAGLVHDVGALQYSSADRVRLLEFETDNQFHAEAGYRLLKIFKPFEPVAEIVRYHHEPWGRHQAAGSSQVPLSSFIIHLADRISTLVGQKQNVLIQVDQIKQRICDSTPEKFHPELVDAFLGLSEKEAFWLDIVSASPVGHLLKRTSMRDTYISNEDLLDLTAIFSHIIDFRSRFTATHSAGVAAVAGYLAEKSGFNRDDCLHMRVAAYLHDLGKLAIPTEILEKPEQLTAEEFSVVRAHSYHTYRILNKIPAFHKIAEWAAYHHEKQDGTGYPFHLGEAEMNQGSKIMIVADVFTALTEDRPYRKGLSPQQTLGIMRRMEQEQALHAASLDLLEKHLSTLISLANDSQQSAREKYDQIFRTWKEYFH